ncbi:unnamed protein product [Moneuplotes crassus]|uniref:EamA domain-containing protein n=2 Tax=Euplotes crassus TaxID=5936 RepID=A0AAD1UMV3_EUPCR|nr:unnamed protein product [Moneuplotes crassus]
MAETISPYKLWTLIGLLLLSSSLLGIMLKMMDMVEVDGKEFEHPFFQSLIMFVGESLCILVYLFQKYRTVKEYGSVQASPGMRQAVQEGMKTDINPLMFAIPMLCDAAASTLLLIGYINIPASIVQMMGGFIVLVVAVMSIIFLKKKQYRHHWLGIALIFVGIGMVAATALLNKDDSSSKNPILGISMLIGSILIQGCQYIVEEKLLGSYYLNPMKVVGWEGITGTILFAILLPILQFIPCDAAICSNGVVEDTRLAFSQIGKSTLLVLFVIGNIVFVAGMNGLGMAVTKYASSTSRVTLSQAKTILVWLFFLIIPTFTNIKGETFSFLQLGGFVVMLIGIVIYNEIVSIPFLGFSDSTKANLEKRKLRAKSLNYNEDTIDEAEADLMTNDASDYAASSPKAYDYQRNYKRLQNQMSEKAGGSSADSYFKIEDE